MCSNLRYVLIVFGLAGRIVSIRDGIEAHATGEYNNDADKENTKRVDLVVDAYIARCCHRKHNHKDYDASVAVAELGEVDVVRYLLRWATSQLNEIQDDGVQVLR